MKFVHYAYSNDGGCYGCLVALERGRDNPGAEAEVAKRNESHRFVVLPKRWVGARFFLLGKEQTALEKLRA